MTEGVACESRDLEAATEVAWQLESLGYGDGYLYAQPPQEVITDVERWNAFVDEVEWDGGLTPDFATQAVFVNGTRDDGCGPEPTYHGCLWGDELRLQVTWSSDTSCDLYLPSADLLLADLDGATDVDWCQ